MNSHFAASFGKWLALLFFVATILFRILSVITCSVRLNKQPKSADARESDSNKYQVSFIYFDFYADEINCPKFFSAYCGPDFTGAH